MKAWWNDYFGIIFQNYLLENEMLDQEIINRNRNINRGYRKLEVWQEGIKLFVLVQKKLKSIDSIPFKVKAQIEDSVLSCPSNSRRL